MLDDVTPLIRAQKVAAWREVARRLAHEIKNPLTPIQLSAERLRRHFAGAPPAARALVDECTDDDRRRGRVAEGAGRRVLAVRAHAGAADGADRSARAASTTRWRSTTASSPTCAFERRFARGVPLVRLDPEQIRRVIINLVDNAIEAMERRGRDRRRDAATTRRTAWSRVVVADDGPGIPAGEREKLFLPYYSTKRRGSGLGLAIVRRIIAEHGGSIEVGDNTPRGTRFTIELPC